MNPNHLQYHIIYFIIIYKCLLYISHHRMMTFQTLPKAGKVTCCRVHEMLGNKTHIAGKRVWSISRPVSVLLVPSLLIEWDPTFRSGSHYVALVPLTLMGHPNMWKHIWPCQRCAFECVANVLELTLELLGSTNAIQCTHKHTHTTHQE